MSATCISIYRYICAIVAISLVVLLCVQTDLWWLHQRSSRTCSCTSAHPIAGTHRAGFPSEMTSSVCRSAQNMTELFYMLVTMVMGGFTWACVIANIVTIAQSHSARCTAGRCVAKTDSRILQIIFVKCQIHRFSFSE